MADFTSTKTAVNEAAFDQFRQNFRGPLIRPGDPNYNSARRVWNGMIDRYPALIARCTGLDDVVAAVAFARRHNLLVAVRGGGHNVAGNAVCDDGLVIDLSPMQGVSVDAQAQTVRVQAGATIGAVDRATQKYGLATPTGNVSETGIAGLTLGGGLSWLRRKYGMNIDSLLSTQVVTAGGRILTANKMENADLFWGLRGGGGNFGIVTSFEFQLYPVGPELYFVAAMYPFEQARSVLQAWRAFTATAPDEASTDAFIWRIPPVPAFAQAHHHKTIVGVAGMYAGPVAEGEQLLQPLRELSTPLIDMSGPMPYVAAQSAFDAFFPAHQLRYYWKSVYLSSLSDEVIEAIVSWAASRPSPLTFIPIRHLGGAISRVSNQATPISNRQAPYLLSIDMTWVDPANTERNITWTRNFWEAMQPYSSNSGIYLNFAGLGEEGKGLLQGAHGQNYEQLVELKNKYDPDNFFHLNHNIKPTV